MHPIKRRRPKSGTNTQKEARAKYFIRNLNKDLIPVCYNTFLKALRVSRFRVNRIAQRYHMDGEMAKERRGGNTTGNKFVAKKENVMQFLNKLKCSETHYCVNRTGRKYLPAELNITKLWRMYIAETENENLHVKQHYFRYIFNRSYNLGFGSPRVDVCSTCLSLQEKIKACKNEPEKANLMVLKRVHRLKYKKFYTLLKENRDDLLILSFDCQKNQPLPKLPDQSAYYCRQLYLNNFCIVKGHSKSKLTLDNVTSFVWTENEFSKGSNVIASCLFHSLKSIDMTPYTVVRLISDGCGGQNKNTILLSMLCSWFRNNAPANIKEIQLVFPITGHSFLPPDRVFANIEKDIRKSEVIVSPEEYVSKIARFATVLRLGDDVVVQDWKTATTEFMKKPGSLHFSIQSAKRIYFTKKTLCGSRTIVVQGENTYTLKSDLPASAKSITKRGQHLQNLVPQIIGKGNHIAKEQKKRDVNYLLEKHYGEHWRSNESLKFFIHVLDGQDLGGLGEELEEDCHAAEEVQTIQI